MERSDSNSVEEQLLILNKSLYCSDLKLSFRPWHLFIYKSLTTWKICLEHNTEKSCNILSLLAYLEESGTGIRHKVSLAALDVNGNFHLWYYYLVSLCKSYGAGIDGRFLFFAECAYFFQQTN